MHRWQKHILFWVAIYFIWMYMKWFGVVLTIPNITINLVQLSAYIALYYTLSEWLIPNYFDKERWVIFGLTLVLVTVVVVVIWYGLMGVVSTYFTVPKTTIPDTWGRYLLEAVQMFVPGLILLAWESYDDSERKAVRLHELEKEQLSAELNYLKSKVNPQFIFNTLNSLKAHVRQKSDHAPDMILTLSEILDYTLYKSQQPLVKLEEETKVIEGYVKLENIRFEGAIGIEMSTHGDLSKTIAPLTLLSFVERVISEKASYNFEKSNVDISIYAEVTLIRCDISMNTVNRMLSNDALNLIEQQIQITYPNQYKLSQENKDHELFISLTLKVPI